MVIMSGQTDKIVRLELKLTKESIDEAMEAKDVIKKAVLDISKVAKITTAVTGFDGPNQVIKDDLLDIYDILKKMATTLKNLKTFKIKPGLASPTTGPIEDQKPLCTVEIMNPLENMEESKQIATYLKALTTAYGASNDDSGYYSPAMPLTHMIKTKLEATEKTLTQTKLFAKAHENSEAAVIAANQFCQIIVGRLTDSKCWSNSSHSVCILSFGANYDIISPEVAEVLDLLNSGVSVTLVISALLYYKYGIRVPLPGKNKKKKNVEEAKTQRRRKTHPDQEIKEIDPLVEGVAQAIALRRLN